MKGLFRITGVKDRAALGFGVTGFVLSGTLVLGMEDFANQLIIKEIRDCADTEPLIAATKGDRCLLVLSDQGAVLKKLEKQTIEFSDMRTEPVNKTFILQPDVI